MKPPWEETWVRVDGSVWVPASSPGAEEARIALRVDSKDVKDVRAALILKAPDMARWIKARVWMGDHHHLRKTCVDCGIFEGHEHRDYCQWFSIMTAIGAR